MDLALRYFFKVIGTPIKRLALALIFEEECALKRVFFSRRLSRKSACICGRFSVKGV